MLCLITEDDEAEVGTIVLVSKKMPPQAAGTSKRRQTKQPLNSRGERKSTYILHSK